MFSDSWLALVSKMRSELSDTCLDCSATQTNGAEIA